MGERAAAATFHAANTLLFPATLLGYALWTGSLLARRGSGVSATAQGPLSARWFAHVLGSRRDEAAARMIRVLPGVPPLGPRLVAWSLQLAHRLSGYAPRAFRYPFVGDVRPVDEAAARMAFFDGVVDRHLTTVDQIVVLGAGFDTRAFRRSDDGRVRWFEVDMPKTQEVKREMLKRAGLDAGHVTFVAADFETEDWFAKLRGAGFDAEAPAIFLWEGVTMYLDEAAVVATFRKIAGTAPHSVVAFDYFTREALDSPALYWRYARATTRAADEPLTFGVDSTPPVRERVADLLRSCGLSLSEHRTLGRETGGRRAWGGFATAVVTGSRSSAS